MEKYIIKETIGWQFGNKYYPAGSEVELTKEEYLEYSPKVKLEKVKNAK